MKIGRKRTSRAWALQAEIVAAYRSGTSLRQIEKDTGIGYGTVRDVLIKNDIPFRGRRHGVGQHHGTLAKVRRIRDLRQIGCSYAEIGDLLGMTGPGVFKHERRHLKGLPT